MSKFDTNRPISSIRRIVASLSSMLRMPRTLHSHLFITIVYAATMLLAADGAFRCAVRYTTAPSCLNLAPRRSGRATGRMRKEQRGCEKPLSVHFTLKKNRHSALYSKCLFVILGLRLSNVVWSISKDLYHSSLGMAVSRWHQ